MGQRKIRTQKQTLSDQVIPGDQLQAHVHPLSLAKDLADAEQNGRIRQYLHADEPLEIGRQRSGAFGAKEVGGIVESASLSRQAGMFRVLAYASKYWKDKSS